MLFEQCVALDAFAVLRSKASALLRPPLMPPCGRDWPVLVPVGSTVAFVFGIDLHYFIATSAAFAQEYLLEQTRKSELTRELVDIRPSQTLQVLVNLLPYFDRDRRPTRETCSENHPVGYFRETGSDFGASFSRPVFRG